MPFEDDAGWVIRKSCDDSDLMSGFDEIGSELKDHVTCGHVLRGKPLGDHEDAHSRLHVGLKKLGVSVPKLLHSAAQVNDEIFRSMPDMVL